MTNYIQKLIKEVEKAESADGLLEAVETLAAAKSEVAIPTLIEVLGYNNPGAAVAAVEGLIEIGEIAIPSLLENIDSYNYGARAWIIRVFAGIGDPRALEQLLKAASDFSLSVRRAAARGLGTIQWSKLPPEERFPAQQQVLKTLLEVSHDPEWVVRYAAVVGLENLARGRENKDDFMLKIKERFNEIIATDGEIALQARTHKALAEIKNV